MKCLFTLLVTVFCASVCFLSGCSKDANGPDETLIEQNTSDQGEAVDSVAEANDGSISLDEVDKLDSQAYVVKNDKCYQGFTSFEPFDGSACMGLVYEDGSLSEETYRFEVGQSGKELPFKVDRSSGDGVICTSSDFDIYPVVEHGFCLGFEPVELDEVNGVEVNKDINATKEALAISGVSLKKNWEAKSQSLDFGGYITFLYSDVPNTATVGIYKDGEWKKRAFHVECPYYAYSSLSTNNVNYEGSLVEKTKEGFFKVNLDGISPGVYMICDFDAGVYLPVEIV